MQKEKKKKTLRHPPGIELGHSALNRNSRRKMHKSVGKTLGGLYTTRTSGSRIEPQEKSQQWECALQTRRLEKCE